MPVYEVPMEFDSENKIIGGILSLRQVAYIAMASSLDLGIFFLEFLPMFIRVTMMMPISIVAVAFAFYELPVHGRLDKLLFDYYRYTRRPKVFIQGGGR